MKAVLAALLFDLDGTLTHSDPIHFRTWQVLLQEYGLTFDRTFYDAHFSGRTNAAIVQDLFPHFSEEQAQALSDTKEAEFRRRAAGELVPIAGAPELLAWAEAEGLQQAVVTNAPRLNAEFMLETTGLGERLPIVILGEELPKGKPDPMPYQVALERFQVPAAAAVAFEDSPAGIRSAVGAGIATVAIASTHSPEQLYQAGATLVIPDFTDTRLMDLLKNALKPTVLV